MNITAQLLGLAALADKDSDAAAALVEMLQVRRVDSDAGLTLALTVDGLDLYLHRSDDGALRTISVGVDELPTGAVAVVESLDGMSWEQELP